MLSDYKYNKNAVPIAYDKNNIFYYNEIKDKNKDSIKSINILPIFNINNLIPCIVYISAPSRSGKTYLTIQLLKQFLIKKRKIFIIGNTPEDYEDVKSKIISVNDFVGLNNETNNLNEKLIKFKHRKKHFDDEQKEQIEIELNRLKNIKKEKNNYIIKNWEKLKNSVVVFDDWEHDSADNIEKSWFLINNICTRGRHNNTGAIIITHLTTHFLHSRTLLNEANYIILFNKTLFKYLNYLCSIYLGFENINIKKIVKLLEYNRWVSIDRNNLHYLITPDEITII